MGLQRIVNCVNGWLYNTSVKQCILQNHDKGPVWCCPQSLPRVLCLQLYFNYCCEESRLVRWKKWLRRRKQKEGCSCRLSMSVQKYTSQLTAAVLCRQSQRKQRCMLKTRPGKAVVQFPALSQELVGPPAVCYPSCDNQEEQEKQQNSQAAYLIGL